MRNRVREKQGAALGVVLMIAAIALLAAFTAAGVSTMGLRVSTRLSNAVVAQSLAESVVQEGAARIQLNLGFHEAIEIGAGLQLPEGSVGRLSFERDAGIPYSTNNFLDDQNQGWERTLPPHTAHLIGRGESGGVVRHVEVLLHLPEFPVALACDGPVLVTNSLISAFEPEDDRPWVPGSGFDVDEKETEPAHLVTNSESGDACVLDRRTKITGDLQARGGIRLNGAVVEGEVRSPWGQEAPLPNFDIDKFDPKKSPNTHYEDLTQIPPSLSLIGTTRRTGNMLLTSGLHLDNAFLFVEGDLTVNGPLRGVGAVVVTGRCRFQGAVDIRSNEQVAVISGGGIEAVGESSDRSIFQGLLYTKGPFIARKLTILGGFIVDDGAPTQIADCSIFYSGTHVTPKMKKEVFAVIPRFVAPQANTPNPPVLFSDPEMFFPTGNWPLPTGLRTVRNVLDQDDPDWARSTWSQTDSAVISVEWVNNEARFTYSYWGLDTSINPRLDDASNPAGAVWSSVSYPTLEEMVDGVSSRNTSNDVRANIRGTPPDINQYRQYLVQVGNHLIKSVDQTEDFNFQLDPNEFISDGEDIRVLFRRVF